MKKYLMLIVVIQSFIAESAPVVKKIDVNNAFLEDASEDVSCVEDFIDNLDEMFECIDKKTQSTLEKKQKMSKRLKDLRQERLDAEKSGLFCSGQLSEAESIECKSREAEYNAEQHKLYMKQLESVRNESSSKNKDKSFTSELLEAMIGGLAQGATQAIVNDLLDIEPCRDKVKIKTKQTIPGAPQYGKTVKISTTKCPDPLLIK